MRGLLCSLSVILFFLSVGHHAIAEDPHPAGFEQHKFNPPEQQPVTEDGVTTFRLAPGVCSNVDYDDGRGEYDCMNGNARSNLRLTTDYGIGESVEYRFEVRVDPSLAYEGFSNMAANGFYPNGMDSHLRIASWEGPLKRNFIYMLKVSTTHGIDFLAQQCQSPTDFGKWVTFSLKTLWASDTKGWVVASCNDRVIYVDEGVATNQAPQCWPSNECEPWVPKDPKSFNFILGPVMMGFGPDWRKIPGAEGLFDEIQQDGITIQMRNVSVTKGATLYDDAGKAAIKALQTRLTELGCDPGPADGVSGNRTRQAALSCKQFPEGVLPSKLTLATVQTFLDAYNGADVANLPSGSAPGAMDDLPRANFVVHPAEESAQRTGRDIEVNSNMIATIEGAEKGENKLDFILFGTFNYRDNIMGQLEFILQTPLDKAALEALKACGPVTVTYPDGSVHAIMRMKRSGPTSFVPAQLECLVGALPNSQAAEVTFLAENFRDIAIGMLRDGTIDKVRHEGVAIFFRRVAAGDVVVGVPAS